MKKYNPNVTINPSEKCENIAILKDLLSDMNVYTLANLDLEELEHLQSLLLCGATDETFMDHFPDVAITSYNNVYGHPIYRDRALVRKSKKSNSGSGLIDWSDAAVLQRQRGYIRDHLIPSCRRKVCDMLSSKTYRQIRDTIPLENLQFLQQMLNNFQK